MKRNSRLKILIETGKEIINTSSVTLYLAKEETLISAAQSNSKCHLRGIVSIRVENRFDVRREFRLNARIPACVFLTST